MVPFLKKFESTVRCCTQNGIRGGSATVHFPIWHQEIEDIIVLKNNKGTEDNRVRKLDYSIQISKLFYERFIKDEEIRSFSPHDVPGLYDAFGTNRFDDLYVGFERDESVPRKTIGAQKLILDLLKERAETGRLYIMNIDHCNSHSSFKDKVNMSNLCQEITLPTDPINHIDDDYGEIALCILSAVNVGKIKSDEELEDLCDLSVRGLEELIDYQEYPVKAAERATKARRSLGVGFIGLAHYLAKLGYNYDSQEAWDAVHGLSESFQYYLLKSSNQIAKEKDPGVLILGVQSMLMVSFPLIHTRRMLMRSLVLNTNMIGKVLEHLSPSTAIYGTQHCLLRCHQRAVPLCQTQQMESSYLETICPLKRAKKDRSNRLFLNMELLKTIIRFFGIWSPIVVMLMLLL